MDGLGDVLEDPAAALRPRGLVGGDALDVLELRARAGDEDDFMLNAVTRLEDGRCFLFSADDDFMQSYVSKQRFMAVL